MTYVARVRPPASRFSKYIKVKRPTYDSHLYGLAEINGGAKASGRLFSSFSRYYYDDDDDDDDDTSMMDIGKRD